MTRVQLFLSFIALILISQGLAQKDAKVAKSPSSGTPKQSDNGKAGMTKSSSGKGTVSSSIVVKSKSGKFRGSLRNGGRYWRKIPFAKPPLGNLRFAAPVPANKINNEYDSTAVPAGCLQTCDPNYPRSCPPVQSEDCLYLSVMSPMDGTSSSKYPVLIWIHGGAYITGYGADSAEFDPQVLVRKGVVVVMINYRLNVFGFLASPVMSGNYGMLDQRMAMIWVQQNIGSFGGDPSKVTIQGQSAGAASVLSHLISPGSAKLFSKAIIESAPVGAGYDSRAVASANSIQFCASVHCVDGDLACLRKLPAADIIAAAIEMQPVVDPIGELPLNMYDAIKTGALANKPLIVGFNAHEGLTFAFQFFSSPLTAADFGAVLTSLYGASFASIVQANYPFVNVKNGDGRYLLADFIGDYWFVCYTLMGFYKANQVAKNKPPVYMYNFAMSATASDFPYCIGYSCHDQEIPFAYGKLDHNGYKAPAAEKALATSMNNAFVNFIKTGNPNKGLPLTTVPFIEYTVANSARYVVLDTGSKSKLAKYEHIDRCLATFPF